jgi:hypothetical protein
MLLAAWSCRSTFIYRCGSSDAVPILLADGCAVDVPEKRLKRARGVARDLHSL